MKQKVINVTYRKDSETFPKWMKYEIEILNEDGTTEMRVIVFIGNYWSVHTQPVWPCLSRCNTFFNWSLT